MQVTEIIARLLDARGLDASFLSPSPPEKSVTLSTLSILSSDFQKAKNRLMKAKKRHEQIVIYGDYDVDGVAASTILWHTLKRLGYKVTPFLPNRKEEGYGFSDKGVKRALSLHKPSLIIAVDHGIGGGAYVSDLKKEGVDVIVIDHHKKTGIYPKDAVAIFYSTLISAAGLAYVFAREFSKVHNSLHSFITVDAVALAGIASLTDIMRQEHMNRSLAFHGVRNISNTTLPGLRDLLTVSGLGIKEWYTSYDVGYIIGPRINAAGRIGDALDAMRALCASSGSSAHPYVQKLENANRQRQILLEEQYSDAKQKVDKDTSRVLFVVSENYDEGIVGLIAGRLAREKYVPVLVGSKRDTLVKGSARSIHGIDITGIFDKNRKLFTTYGGHEKAAGFTLQADKVSALREALNRDVSKYDAQLFERHYVPDISVDISQIDGALAQQLSLLEPFGEGNPQPSFMSTVLIASSRRVGTKASHVQYVLKSPETGITQKAVLFNADESAPSLGDTVQLLYTVHESMWNGKTTVELHIQHRL